MTPTIGRRLWYFPSAQDLAGDGVTQMTQNDPAQALDAGVVFVHNAALLNLAVTDHKGTPHARESVPLVQDSQTAPEGGGYAEWMPYQLEQAKLAAVPKT